MHHYPHHIGDWAPGRWTSFDPISRFAIPATPGVYVIFFDGRAVYVGQTANLRARFGSHKFRHAYAKDRVLTPWGSTESGVKVTAKARPTKRYGDWAMIEMRLLRRIKPILNSKHVYREAASA